MNAPSVAEAFYRLIDERDRLTAENGRLRRAGKNAIVLADELRAEVARLAADNAELEGALQGSREAMAVCVASENRAVADLARVTGERDALLALVTLVGDKCICQGLDAETICTYRRPGKPDTWCPVCQCEQHAAVAWSACGG